ncbi:MAG: DUF2857 family protein [Cytophagales bacterium]|nr:DUF2857 family protein [Rhizobacter sp.]
MNASAQIFPNPAGAGAVFAIENDSLGRLITLLLHQRLFKPGTASTDRSLRDLGWHDSLLSEVGAMPADELAKIWGGSNSCVSLLVDQRKVAAGLNSYRALKRDQNDLEFFLVNGATPALIHTLFPSVSSRTVTATRKRLGCESRGGRPPLPDAETSHAIYRCWQALCTQETSLRMRYMRLHKHFPALSLATLCAAIDAR